MFRMANHEVTRGGRVLTKRKERGFFNDIKYYKLKGMFSNMPF